MNRCAKIGCHQRVDPRNGKYCSKEHAPYYHLEGGVDDYLNKSKVKKQEEKPKKPGIYERWQPAPIEIAQPVESVIAKRIEKQSGLPTQARKKKREWLREWRKTRKVKARKMDDRVVAKDIQRCDGFSGSALSINTDGAIRVESLSELVGVLPISRGIRFVDPKTGDEFEIIRVKKK